MENTASILAKAIQRRFPEWVFLRDYSVKMDKTGEVLLGKWPDAVPRPDAATLKAWMEEERGLERGREADRVQGERLRGALSAFWNALAAGQKVALSKNGLFPALRALRDSGDWEAMGSLLRESEALLPVDLSAEQREKRAAVLAALESLGSLGSVGKE
jgi:hypothetical protein